MTNSAYGYVLVPEQDSDRVWDLIVRTAGWLRIGSSREGLTGLANFPSDLVPVASDLVPVCFSINDRSGGHGAEYLLDLVDYAPDSDIGLPTRGADRLELVIGLIERIVADPSAVRVAVALTDAAEIEAVCRESAGRLGDRIREDFAVCAPSNTLYFVDTAR